MYRSFVVVFLIALVPSIAPLRADTVAYSWSGFIYPISGQPNPWGLCDMHGNVAEWTATADRPYPYDSADGRDSPGAPGKKVVRGGSWYDHPKRAGSGYRVAYAPWQRVFNVGFRVVCAPDHRPEDAPN